MLASARATRGGGVCCGLWAAMQHNRVKRYVWRVASALKWAFADLEMEGVSADKETLTPEDFGKVLELLKVRPMQFCLFTMHTRWDGKREY
jgi:hypothetical protein